MTIVAPAPEYETLAAENALLWEANIQHQERIAELERDNTFLRTRHIHQEQELTWMTQLGRVSSSVMSASHKATARALRTLLRSKTPNTDGFCQVEAWEVSKIERMDEGTHLHNINYLSNVYVDGELTQEAKLPLFEKRLVTLVEPGKRGRPSYRVFLKETDLLEVPAYYEPSVLRQHGGAGRNQGRRKKCECGGDIIERDRPLVKQKVGECNKCHVVAWAEEPRQVQEAYLPTDPEPTDPEPGERLKNQLDFNSDEAEEEGISNQLDVVDLHKTSHQVDCKYLEGDPVTPPPIARVLLPSTWRYPLNGFDLSDWLQGRIGHGPIIYSTGQLDQAGKYKTKPEGYIPNIAAYLRGDLQHIYGSRPALTDGTTFLLGFDNEKPELDGQRLVWQQLLAAAGIPSICWLRRPGRWHLEVYVDRAVDRRAFYAHVTQVCPDLLAVPECFPIGRDQNTSGSDRADFPYSWPLYWRESNYVHECAAEVMLAGDQTPMISTGIETDRDRLTWLISQAILDASSIPPLPLNELTDEATAPGGALLDTSQPVAYPGFFDDGLCRVVVAEFNDLHTWKDITGVVSGFFLASWRGERTASVLINDDGQTAHDFGNTGTFPNHFDRFDVYCLIHRLNKTEEIKRRIAEKRQARV